MIFMRVHIIDLLISKAFLIRDEQLMLVDTGLKGEEHKLIRKIEQLGINPLEIDHIVHTHGHVDHCGSTAKLSRLIDAPTVIHEGDLDKVRTGTNGQLKRLRPSAHLIHALIVNSYPPFEPDIVVGGGRIDLAQFGVSGEMIHFPGHTHGSVGLMLGNGDLITGDLLMGGYLGGFVAPAIPRYH